MARYALLNSKGGVGKTTLSVHLAVALAKTGSTILFDGDPQGSAASWAAWRRDSPYQSNPSPTTACLTGRAIFDEGRNLAAKFDHTVIDVGGSDSIALRSAMALAEMCIVPVGASQFDAAAMTDLLFVIDLAKSYNQNLRVRFLLSRIDPRTKDASDMLAFLEEHKLRVLDTRICERVAFRRAIGEGATAPELGKDPAATAEIASLVKEVTDPSAFADEETQT